MAQNNMFGQFKTFKYYAAKGYRAWYLTLGTYIACDYYAGIAHWHLCYYHPIWGTMHRKVSREELRELLMKSVNKDLVNAAVTDMRSLKANIDELETLVMPPTEHLYEIGLRRSAELEGRKQ
jgi:hypothetical protein